MISILNFQFLRSQKKPRSFLIFNSKHEFATISKVFLRINKFVIAKHGFTIIEILVVMTVMMIITSLGFAGFYTYSKQQAVEQTSQDIKIQIEKAKFSALSRVKPADSTNPSNDCPDSSVLTGYRFNVFAQSYTIAAFCSGVEKNVETFNLPNDLSFTQGVGCTINFGTQNNDIREISTGNCAASGNIANIVITGFTFTKKIKVDNGGNVTVQ